MKTFTKLALFLLLISVCMHTYLTFQHYPLKLGVATGPSLCSINSTFDCDAVTTGAYSSFLNVPISVWGAVTNLVLFFALLISWLQWSENPERLKRFSFALALGSVGASIVMGSLSFFFMKNYCPFCIGLYALSALVAYFIFATLKEPFLSNFFSDIQAYFSENRGILGLIISIPILSFIVHKSALSHFGAGELDRMINHGVNSWLSEPKQSLSVDPLLVKGPDKSKASLVISEFADFRCGHCKTASHSLHAFTKSHPDVRFEFYVFPLDGACNSNINHSTGLSCHLAKSVYCAEKQGQGWNFHDIIFQYQDQLASIAQVDVMKDDLLQLTKHLTLDRSTYDTCIESPETHEAIEYQGQQGVTLGIQGTPTIFANGKLLPMGQMIPVLEGVYKKAR